VSQLGRPEGIGEPEKTGLTAHIFPGWTSTGTARKFPVEPEKIGTFQLEPPVFPDNLLKIT